MSVVLRRDEVDVIIRTFRRLLTGRPPLKRDGPKLMQARNRIKAQLARLRTRKRRTGSNAKRPVRRRQTTKREDTTP